MFTFFVHSYVVVVFVRVFAFNHAMLVYMSFYCSSKIQQILYSTIFSPQISQCQKNVSRPLVSRSKLRFSILFQERVIHKCNLHNDYDSAKSTHTPLMCNHGRTDRHTQDTRCSDPRSDTISFQTDQCHGTHRVRTLPIGTQ